MAYGSLGPIGERAARELPYAVRESARARRVRLTVTPRDGLVVVVPRGFPREAVRRLVESKRAWAERALEAVAARRALYDAGPDALLPDAVDLLATSERFVVEQDVGARGTVRETEGRLRVLGVDADARLDGLQRWLGRAARARLEPELARLADEHGYRYERVRIGRPRTRWGSCSARGTISLSRNLLFLPPGLTRSVLLHELAHTRRLDHSPAFHAELVRIDPHAAEHRRLLRGAHDLVPAWADA